jgi:hypothetical protein
MYDERGFDWPEPSDSDISYDEPPLTSTARIRLRDREGSDMAEWPEDLQVREFPR